MNNRRQKDGIPALGFDWFNYGGITRDVNLVETPASYIEDYFIQIKRRSADRIDGWVQLGGEKKSTAGNDSNTPKQKSISIPQRISRGGQRFDFPQN